MVVFLDTSAIYALANAADANHQRAVQCLRAAMDAGEDLLVHNYILVESSALLHRRLGWAAVSRFSVKPRPSSSDGSTKPCTDRPRSVS